MLRGLVEDLKGVGRGDARHAPLLQQLTANFDDFPEQVIRGWDEMVKGCALQLQPAA